MIKKYYTCKLKTDIILNASLATEGNIKSLDYIPGSNFLGIVASGDNYKKFKEQGKAYALFHNGDVSYGDAHISPQETESFAMPFCFFKYKVPQLKEDNTLDNTVFIHHELTDENDRDLREKSKQLKQLRNGFICNIENEELTHITNVEKQFILKSAYDAEERRAKDKQLFGLDSIKGGQTFSFSIIYQDEKLIPVVEDHLIGDRSIGKSKSAEYGQVSISLRNDQSVQIINQKINNRLVIYFESNTCLENEFGYPTLQPTLQNFDLKKGTIDYKSSQIRSYQYSTWNGFRNTEGTQRNCIAKGSVLIIDDIDSLEVNNLPRSIGAYQSEGLGRIQYNPEWMAHENGITKFNFKEFKSKTITVERPTYGDKEIDQLINVLDNQFAKQEKDIRILNVLNDVIASIQDKSLSKISSSQWGQIRSFASQTKDFKSLEEKLFGPENNTDESKIGELCRGVAYEEYWGVSNERPLKNLKGIFKKDEVRLLGSAFIERFASEMAKKNRNN